MPKRTVDNIVEDLMVYVTDYAECVKHGVASETAASANAVRSALRLALAAELGTLSVSVGYLMHESPACTALKVINARINTLLGKEQQPHTNRLNQG